MMKHRSIRVGAVAALFLMGCSINPAEFNALQEQVHLQQKQMVDLKSRQDEQQAKMEILDNSFRIMGDKIEENSMRLDDLGNGVRMAPPTSRPITTAPAPAPIAAPRPVVTPAVKPPPVPAAAPMAKRTPPMSAADLYRTALDSFTQENYQGAILEFEEFVANYPGHDLADNAQYWIGECYYAKKDFEGAVREFEKVEKHFGGGNKAVAALLKKGFALRELGRNQEALAALEGVVSKYPMSDEAITAEKKLSQWQ